METTHIDHSNAPKADATAFLIRYNAPRFMVDRAMKETVLTDRDIRRMLDASPPLLEGIRDVATQIQACGVDLTVRTVSRFENGGAVGYDNADRVLASTTRLPWSDGWVELPAGPYLIVYNEQVNLPDDVMALAYPRSSLMRCGVTIYSAVWDPGYSGRAEALLVVHNPHGFRLKQGSRVVQLVFTRLSSPVIGRYEGRFLKENL
jgi:dUTP pyrophosphatase